MTSEPKQGPEGSKKDLIGRPEWVSQWPRRPYNTRWAVAMRWLQCYLDWSPHAVRSTESITLANKPTLINGNQFLYIIIAIFSGIIRFWRPISFDTDTHITYINHRQNPSKSNKLACLRNSGKGWNPPTLPMISWPWPFLQATILTFRFWADRVFSALIIMNLGGYKGSLGGRLAESAAQETATVPAQMQTCGCGLVTASVSANVHCAPT